MNERLAGIFCALWTPLDESGELDERALRSNLEFVIEQKVHGIMALGSTGEFPRLRAAQRKRVLEFIRELAGNRPIIANASHVQWRTAADLALHAKSLGAAAIALLPPWFFPMEQAEITEFFVRVAETAGLPLAIYNFPEMTGKRVELETIRETARRVPVCAVKQSGGDFDYHRPLASLAAELGFSLLTGADASYPEAWEAGAAGTVSGLSNAVPELLMRIHAGLSKGDAGSIRREAAFMGELGRRMERLPFPLNVRAAIEARGAAIGAFKSPVSSATRERYAGFVGELREFYAAERLF